MRGKSWNRIVVDARACTENYRFLQSLAGSVPVLAMVKADAYGHGMVYTARAFAEGGCRHFGVAELSEGVALRASGVAGQIIVSIGFAAEEASLFFDYALTPVICTPVHAAALEREAAKRDTTIDVHLKINTGMGRLGLLPEEVKDFAEAVEQYPHLRIAGAMSHFPEADTPGAASTLAALDRFQPLRQWLRQRYNAVCHIANSAALFNHPEAYCDMVRAGIALYGYHPAGEAGREMSGFADRLVPAMRFSSRILQVKEYPQGTTISYGCTFVTPKKMKIAVIPVGYEDGLDRLRSNGGVVLVGGKRVPICGRICMNMSMLDVSELSAVAVGDEVVLLGRQQDEMISADEIAAETGTISYEVLCRFGHMNNHFSE